MNSRRGWLGAVGTAWMNGTRVADVEEWWFNVEPPAAEQFFRVERLLKGARGHFVLSGGGPDALVDAVRANQPVLLRCEAGLGTFEVEVTVNLRLARIPDVVVELFEFQVSGEVRRAETP